MISSNLAFWSVTFSSCATGRKAALGDHRPADHIGERQDVLLDLGCEAEQAQENVVDSISASTSPDGKSGNPPQLYFCLFRMARIL